MVSSEDFCLDPVDSFSSNVFDTSSLQLGI
jgi:hypothetical protein